MWKIPSGPFIFLGSWEILMAEDDELLEKHDNEDDEWGSLMLNTSFWAPS